MIGLLGTAVIIAAYAYLNFGKGVNPFLFNGLNLLGAALLAISLTVHYNFASLVLEGVWAMIAVLGLLKAALESKKP